MSISPAPSAAIAGRSSYLDILNAAWEQHLAPRKLDAPTVISTFAGCGGSSLGYGMAGYRELLAVEWDDNAVATFRLNFPEVPVYHGDIAKLSVEQCMEMAGIGPGELDVLDGSPPCQGFSTAGKRVLDDPRNGLFREYIRLLRGLRPRCFVMENVSGMVKGKMKLVFAEIMRELKASGYRVSARLMNAMYFNVPQSRERMIFVGVREDLGIVPSHPKAAMRALTVRDAITDLPSEQVETLNHVWVDEWARQTKAIQQVVNLSQGERLNGRQRIRLWWDKPAPTITKSIVGKPYVACTEIHPAEHRAISVREMARLASYPDYFMFVAAMENGKARIGNSVPPLFLRAVATHIRTEILNKADSNYDL